MSSVKLTFALFQGPSRTLHESYFVLGRVPHVTYIFVTLTSFECSTTFSTLFTLYISSSEFKSTACFGNDSHNCPMKIVTAKLAWTSACPA